MTRAAAGSVGRSAAVRERESARESDEGRSEGTPDEQKSKAMGAEEIE